MQIKFSQLTATLDKGLASAYLISGDEPLQLLEAGDAVRSAARQAGYAAREILNTDAAGFSWSQLTMATDNRSIFADQKLIELRGLGSSPGIEGAKALTAYCANPAPETVLLLVCGKLAKEATKSKWFQALDKIAVIVQVWPIEGQEWLQWLQARLQARGLQTGPDGLKLLAEKLEGNLPAAAQEIEKLHVLHGSGALSVADIAVAVADNARFDVFKLTDSLLQGKAGRALKILAGLKAEGMAAPVVLWALLREARMLAKIQWALAQGQTTDHALRNHQVWDKRKPWVLAALQRLSERDLNQILLLSAQADRQSKGQQPGDAWATLKNLCLLMASVRPLSIAP